MALLCLAQLVVRWLPWRWWRATLGRPTPPGDGPTIDSQAIGAGHAALARRLAVHVERGAARLPFTILCLPRAMALCWLLRAAGIGYALNIAARPAAARHGDPMAIGDTLHAWVEAEGRILIGALPGPWLVVLVLRSRKHRARTDFRDPPARH